jgi:hypothetical protein
MVPTPPSFAAAKCGSLLRSFGAPPRRAPRRSNFVADDMEKNRGPMNQQPGQHGTQSGRHGQGQGGQTGQKRGGQGAEDDEES